MSGDVDFGTLLDRSAFRADLLYFIRLAGNYAANIVIDCRARASKKDKAAFSHWLGLDVGKARERSQPEPSAKKLQERLWKQFLTRNPAFVSNVDKKPLIKQDIWRALVFNEPWFDVFKTDFPTLMSEMPIAMRERLSSILQKDHLLPWDTGHFLSAIEDLTTYRHWLEHPDEKIKKGELRPMISDQRLLAILGLMLLPFLGNHLVGRIRHHERRKGVRGSAMIADHAKTVLANALATRRDTSKFMNGLKTRSDHATIAVRITKKYGNVPRDIAVHRIAKEDAKKRRDLEQQKSAMLALHRRYFNEETWPRYNHENFLMRFAFIGRRRITALENKLDIAKTDRPDFINAIEPAFILSVDVALVIHVWLTQIAEMGIKFNTDKRVDPVILGLRNAIAHGDWIWHIADKSRNDRIFTFEELITALLKLPQKVQLNDSAQRCNDLLTQLESTLRPCAWTYVYAVAQMGDDANQMPARYLVKRWSDDKRTRFANKSRFRMEKRSALRRLAASWMRDIAKAQQNLRKI